MWTTSLGRWQVVVQTFDLKEKHFRKHSGTGRMACSWKIENIGCCSLMRLFVMLAYFKIRITTDLKHIAVIYMQPFTPLHFVLQNCWDTLSPTTHRQTWLRGNIWKVSNSSPFHVIGRYMTIYLSHFYVFVFCISLYNIFTICPFHFEWTHHSHEEGVSSNAIHMLGHQVSSFPKPPQRSSMGGKKSFQSNNKFSVKV